MSHYSESSTVTTWHRFLCVATTQLLMVVCAPAAETESTYAPAIIGLDHIPVGVRDLEIARRITVGSDSYSSPVDCTRMQFAIST
jgi:hypothetical protein